MIVFDLICSDGHRFESWFRNGAAYDAQSEGNAIVCPVCGATSVGKAPMRLHVARSGGVDRTGPPDRDAAQKETKSPPPSAPAPMPVPEPAAAMRMALRKLIEATCDNVGREFPEQARRIHYGESGPRNIYGEASTEEADALREEGITVQPLPWMRRRND